MTSEIRLKRIQQFIGRIPSLSTTVAKVLEICNNPGASANDLNRVISYDPVLTAQVLKLINSAYYGLPNRITSLVRAIIMLGINTVKNLVLASSVMAACKGGSNTKLVTINDFWAHCLCVGVLSKLIAGTGNRIPHSEQEEYFVAGLLHDLGKLPLMACFPELYGSTILAARESNCALIESETANIGINHCQVGLLIAAKWNLGSPMQDAISRHHPRESLDDPDFMVDCIGIANLLANHFGVGTAGDYFMDPNLLKSYLDRVGLPAETLPDLKLKMETEIEKASVFLKIADKGALS